MRQVAVVSLLLLSAFAFAGEGDKKLTFDTPKEWKADTVKGGMMAPKHQWTLEKAEGDAEAPLLKVYNFGGQGGSVDDNVKRWCGQFKNKDGDAFPVDKAKKESFKVGDLEVTTVEIEGTYTPPAMMGGGDPKKDQQLVGAVIEGEGGPWLVKLQGPIKSVDKNKDAFVKWLKTAKLTSESK
jgi:hypothetical protein